MIYVSPSGLVSFYSPIDRCSLCYYLFFPVSFCSSLVYYISDIPTVMNATIAIHHLCCPFRPLHRVFVVPI